MASDQEMRDWARANGYNVGERGRLPQYVINAYHNAHGTWQTCQSCGTDLAWRFETPGDDLCRRCTDELLNDQAAEKSPEPTPAPTPPEPPVEAPVPAPSIDAATSQLTAALVALTASQAPNMDEELVRKIARDEAETAVLAAMETVTTPKIYQIQVAGRETVEIDGATHILFEKVVKIVGAGLHAYLVGPPGTGKTTLCGQVAKALSLPFGMIPCDPTMPASKLFGFVDAGGTYQATVFRRIYESGGVFLFDELDNAHPGIIASINGAIANGHCAFPDGMVERSPDFRCVAAANTFGTGATRAFVGRNQLDAATLDRFVTVVVDIDETLEEALTLGACAENVALAKEWLVKVRGWRQKVQELSLQVIISPRAAIEGAKLLSLGFDMADTAEMKVWKGIDAGTRAKIERGY